MLRAACIVMVLAPCVVVARGQVHQHGAQHAEVVDAVVLEEAVVLGGQEGLLHAPAGI